ncbi:hypothetical protein N7537_006199 [Penicillium hordei]|uniref:S-adenosyl-L-methionine-dependent methyltransferase n=1 Tax=Penicillium hordei TaxID=40994 RepID=A0AAD6E7H5_9EURO|nr:uncharacterized protein N7537_006199 [Penicillium hordei]KAJ5603243.1 hypothetical protein N7537_006199 [Penicillium hordei]
MDSESGSKLGIYPVSSIRQLANDILDQCSLMEKECQRTETTLPTLDAGADTSFWMDTSADLAKSRTQTLGLLERLTTLLQGPHDYLHEFVAPNWDHGALYAFLQLGVLEHIASSGGQATLLDLSRKSGVPEDKLYRIMGLLRCKNIVCMPSDDVFALTAMSEDLLHDPDFRAWVEFQLFETRVASAHLADALATTPNDYSNGISGFKAGWGVEMYDWHATHPEKGERFRRAMKGVSKSLDPANSLLLEWFTRGTLSKDSKVVEIGGMYGFASVTLAPQAPDLSFEIRCDSEAFLSRGKALLAPGSNARVSFTHVDSLLYPPNIGDASPVSVFLIRNLLWNWADDDAVRLLRSFLPTLKSSLSARILVTDGVSPLPNEFPPHVEIAYRRRDITTMTMHNVKQRTQVEWLELFGQVDHRMKVGCYTLRCWRYF